MPSFDLCSDSAFVAGVTGLPDELEAYLDTQAGDPNSFLNMGINRLWWSQLTSQSRLITDKVTEATWEVRRCSLVPFCVYIPRTYLAFLQESLSILLLPLITVLCHRQ